MSEKTEAACMHQRMDYKWGRAILVDTNVSVLKIGPLTCLDCGATMKMLGAVESNVLKKRPFTNDNGLTVCLPFVAEGEAVIETPSMETKQ